MEAGSSHNSDNENIDFTRLQLENMIEFMETSPSHNPFGENMDISRLQSEGKTEVTLTMHPKSISSIEGIAQRDGSSYEDLATQRPELAYEMARRAVQSAWLDPDSKLSHIEIGSTPIFTDVGDKDLSGEDARTIVKTLLDDYLPNRYELPPNFTLRINLAATDADQEILGPDTGSFNMYNVHIER